MIGRQRGGEPGRENHQGVRSPPSTGHPGSGYRLHPPIGADFNGARLVTLHPAQIVSNMLRSVAPHCIGVCIESAAFLTQWVCRYFDRDASPVFRRM